MPGGPDGGLHLHFTGEFAPKSRWRITYWRLYSTTTSITCNELRSSAPHHMESVWWTSMNRSLQSHTPSLAGGGSEGKGFKRPRRIATSWSRRGNNVKRSDRFLCSAESISTTIRGLSRICSGRLRRDRRPRVTWRRKLMAQGRMARFGEDSHQAQHGAGGDEVGKHPGTDPSDGPFANIPRLTIR